VFEIYWNTAMLLAFMKAKTINSHYTKWYLIVYKTDYGFLFSYLSRWHRHVNQTLDKESCDQLFSTLRTTQWNRDITKETVQTLFFVISRDSLYPGNFTRQNSGHQKKSIAISRFSLYPGSLCIWNKVFAVLLILHPIIIIISLLSIARRQT